VVACYEVTKQAADYARRGGGAVLIEAKTYRRKGHAEHDDQRYITAGEIEWWEQNNDPVDRYERYLLECNLVTKEKLEQITGEVLREIDEDCAWAESSPLPEGETAAYGVFDNNLVPPAFRPKVLEG
jgi:TPP-dependent pyruvate/acetoin dehydrogenase alpha subunit